MKDDVITYVYFYWSLITNVPSCMQTIKARQTFCHKIQIRLSDWKIQNYTTATFAEVQTKLLRITKKTELVTSKLIR